MLPDKFTCRCNEHNFIPGLSDLWSLACCNFRRWNKIISFGFATRSTNFCPNLHITVRVLISDATITKLD